MEANKEAMTDEQDGSSNLELIPGGDFDDRFLRNIDNPDFYWTFQLVGRRNVTGRVINFLWTSQGIPITLMLQPESGKPFEVPWTSIQTIHQGKVTR